MKRVKIIHRNPDYEALVLTLAQSVRQRALLPFLGAGISAHTPTCLPLAQALTKPLVRMLQTAAQTVLHGTDTDCRDVVLAYRKLAKLRLEPLLDAFHKSFGPRTLRYLEILNGIRWNDNHAALAQLSSKHMLPWCVTLNFDSLIELATAKVGGCIKVDCPLVDHEDIVFGKPPITTTLIKPHGTIVDGSDPDEKLRHLRTTLSEIGIVPRETTRIALRTAFKSTETLVVAGYSDNDWDVFPILEEFSPDLERLVWVEYCKDEDLREDLNTLDQKVHKRVREWLSSLSCETVIAFGPSYVLLRDLAERLTGEFEKPDSRPDNPRVPDTSLFSRTSDHGEMSMARTVITLARLMPTTGEFLSAAIKWLAARAPELREAGLESSFEEIRGGRFHATSEYARAIPHYQRSIATWNSERATTERSLAHTHVWLGYLYLCMCKIPNPILIVRILRNCLRAKSFMALGVDMAEDTEKGRLQDLRSYYWTDLWHTWCGIPMLFGPRSRLVVRWLFQRIHRSYLRICRSTLMEEEYFWMRKIESGILAGLPLGDRGSVERKFLDLQYMHEALQDSMQVGNVYLYRGLISHIVDGDCDRATRHLDEAEKAWNRAGRGIETGNRRIVLFDRFLGLGRFTLWSAVRTLRRGSA